MSPSRGGRPVVLRAGPLRGPDHSRSVIEGWLTQFLRPGLRCSWIALAPKPTATITSANINRGTVNRPAEEFHGRGLARLDWNISSLNHPCRNGVDVSCPLSD